MVAPTSRGTLASAVGMALAGSRATAFLSGPNLAGQLDLLAAAAGRHQPLVIHGVARALNGHAGARGSGHEAWHAISDAGLIQLFARNVQEAVDFALVGRRVAETFLRPVLVYMDDERTAAVTQDVLLPGAELVRRYLGAPGDRIDCPTPAQRMLFGEQRRRVPRWHDLERPVLHGAIQGRGVWSLGAAGSRPFTSQARLPVIEAAFADFAELTGRRYGLLRTHRVEDAEVVLVCQGSSGEAAECVVDHLRTQNKQKVGCISLLGLRPFPGAALVSALQGRPRVAVLERADTLLAEDPPLLRELRAAFARAVENHGGAVHAGYPALAAERVPRLHAAIYGLGGFPLRAGDLVALVEEVRRGGRSLVYLGIDFHRKDTRYPKRKVLLDALAREWPAELAPGLTGYRAQDVRPAGAVTLTVHRVGGVPGGALAADMGRMLHVALGGFVRGRAGENWERWQAPCIDRVVHAPVPVDPGASGPVDVALVLALSPRSARDPLAELRSGGIALVADAGKEGVPLLPQDTWLQLEARHVRVLPVPCPEGANHPDFRERVLGLVLRALGELGRKLPSPKKLVAARGALLDGLDPQEITRRLAIFSAALEQGGAPRSAPDALPIPAMPPSVPMAVRHFHRADGTYDSLPRFWDQVGILFRDGHVEELVPDPYLATSVVPPLTATFNDFTPLRRFFPAWEPALCTGCGRCWTGCPDSAIGPLALPIPTLVEGAMAQAAARGGAMDPLRPLLSKVTHRLGKLLRESKEQPAAFGIVLREAGARVLEKASLPADRAQPVAAALEAAAAVVDDLPIAGTLPFFVDPEQRQAGTGEILSLSVNPDACKGCGICALACPEGAMGMEPQSTERVAWARRDWQRWEQLPDSPGETIARVSAHPGVGPLAAMLLSRTCLLGLSGGDSAEAGSGEKVAVRLLLAAAECQLQPELQRHIDQVEGLRIRLTEAIGERLAKALPTGDPAGIALGLKGLRQPEIDLSALLARVEGQGEHGRVDVAQLRRLSDLAGRLQELRWRLAEGPDGLGRARFSVTIEPGHIASWAGAFPDNPFHVPVVVASAGEGLHLGRGLLEGQLRAVLEDLRLVREARVALEHPGEYARELQSLARLGWHGLTR
ncbi:MAG: 4Fe-4S binding protein [Pseudomonadota bacterium]